MNKVSIHAAIAAGADPRKLGLESVKLTKISTLDPEILWAPSGVKIDVTVTHTRLIVSWPGQPPTACVAVTTAAQMDVKRAEGRYAKYGVAHVAESDGDITFDEALDAALEGERLTTRAKKITDTVERIKRIRHPKGVSPITAAMKRKRKAQRRDAIALAAFIDWCGWDSPTMPYGPTIDKMLAAADVHESDMHNAYLEIEYNKHRNEADFF